MRRIEPDCRAVVTRFVYNMCNGLLAYPLLEDRDYRQVLLDEPSAAEQTIAILLNVLTMDEDGKVLEAEKAEFRAAQYLRGYCDPTYRIEPPLEPWELERQPYNRRSSGPMP